MNRVCGVLGLKVEDRKIRRYTRLAGSKKIGEHGLRGS